MIVLKYVVFSDQLQFRANPRQRALKNLYKTYLDIVHVKKIDKRRLGGDVTTLEHELAEKDQEVEQVRKHC